MSVITPIVKSDKIKILSSVPKKNNNTKSTRPMATLIHVILFGVKFLGH